MTPLVVFDFRCTMCQVAGSGVSDCMLLAMDYDYKLSRMHDRFDGPPD